MAPIKSAKEAARAVTKVEQCLIDAQNRITLAAEKAEKVIDTAAAVAAKALEDTARVPDKRNINGSFQWDRGDRYRRGSDERLQRIEDKCDKCNTEIGLLEVGQAQRVEQIKTVTEDCRGVIAELNAFKGQIADRFDALSPRMTTLRELILEVRDASDAKVDTLRDESRQDKIRNQQYVIGIVVGIVITFISSIIFAYFRS